MLTFKQSVSAPDAKITVYVFADEEKGHTVYVTLNGQMTVVEIGKNSSAKARAAGFFLDNSGGCSGCDGC